MSLTRSEDYATALGFDVSMAFQPVVDVEARAIYAYEALVRGTNGASADAVLAHVRGDNRYAFDQLCRVRAVEIASALGMNAMLCINFFPNAMDEPSRGLNATIEAAQRCRFPIDRIIFEANERQGAADPLYLKQLFAAYRMEGFKTGIDDFGSGYCDLALLADFQPDIIKIDMALIRDVASDRARQTIVGALGAVGSLLGIAVIAKGVERQSEALVLRRLGINLMQGYLFARPAFEALPPVDFDVLQSSSGPDVIVA